MVTTWSSWTAFRADDARRLGPCEVEFGSQWRADAASLPWRVVWVEGTGELVAIQWSAGDQGGRAGPVVLLGTSRDRVEVDVTLKDWWHMCGHIGSLDWVRRRLERAGWGVSAEDVA